MTEHTPATPVLPFDVDDPEFTRGVEVGLLWGHLNSNPEAQQYTVHATNAEMVLRIAESLGRTVQSSDGDDMWLVVKFGLAPREVGDD